MSAGPRVVLVRFRSSASVRLLTWQSHIEKMMATEAAEGFDLSGQAEPVGWHLVSANNRKLARGVAVHPSVESARASAVAIVEGWANLGVTLTRDTRDLGFGWYASLRGNPVIVSARWYSSERAQKNSVELALRSCPVGLVSPAAHFDQVWIGGDRGRAS